MGSSHSPNTLKLHSWVWSLFSSFCSAISASAWPFEPDTLRSFICCLGLTAGYAFTSLADSVVPSLKRIYLQRTGVKLSGLPLESLHLGLHDVKSSKTFISSEKKAKAPAMYVDVCKIISSIPDICFWKNTDAFMFLFSLYCGARAITVSHLIVEDIFFIEKDAHDLIVKVRLRVSKGKRDSDHEVTFRDDPDRVSPDNIIYFLEKMLVQRFRLSLTSWQPDATQSARKLLPFSKNNLCQRLQTRAFMAGYPRYLFGFHSLRTGFICSALLHQGSRNESFVEMTALVGGWRPSERAQIGYLRTAVKSTIISNHLIQPNSPNPLSSTRNINPETFHRIQFTPSPYLNSAKKSFYDAIHYFSLNTVPYKQSVKVASRIVGVPQTRFHQHLSTFSSLSLILDLVHSVFVQLQLSPTFGAVLHIQTRVKRKGRDVDASLQGEEQSHAEEQQPQEEAKPEQQKDIIQEKQAEGVVEAENETNQDQEYEVEAIVSKKGKKYKVKWRGYEETTWEDEQNLTNCSELVEEYKKRRKK